MSFGECLTQYKKKESGNAPTSSDSNQSMQEKDKTFNYSTNSGLEVKPCEKPYENDNGVELNFNFWTDNRCIIDGHVVEMLVQLLNRKAPSILRAKSSFIDCLKEVILVSAHGIDPRELGVEVKSLSFLSQCSSMPINHVQVLDTGLTSNPVRWQYLDAEDMNSLVLWPERPSLEGEDLLKLPNQCIFREYNSVFLAEHSDWQDEIFFSIDSTVTKETISTLVKPKVDICSDYLKPWYHEAVSSIGEEATLGRFKRLRSGDSGVFVLSSSASVLYLLWNKWDVEVLDLIPTKDDNDKGFMSFAKRLPQHKIETIVTDLYLELKKATLRPVNEAHNVDTRLSASESSTSRVDNVLSELKDTYQALIANPSSYACTLEDLVLSPSMMSMMGYTLHTFQESGFLDTKSCFWNGSSGSSTGRVGSHVRFDEVEDGEEVESDEIAVPTESVKSQYELLRLCAIDCEMCATEAGLELTRITVICPERGVVYDTLVQPKRPIVDYHTAYSGITKEALEGVNTMIEDVHNVLKQLIDRNTIIVGHSLDSDLKTLHLVHSKVIDTAALFPHVKGLPFKNSLKNLAKEYLNKDIQEGEGSAGHDSIQDSAIALQLAFLKAMKGDAVGGFYPWKDNAISRYNLFEHLNNQVCSEKSAKAALQCSVHSCLSHQAKSEWERHAFGYGSESDASIAARLFQTNSCDNASTVTLHSHSTVDSVVEKSCVDLKSRVKTSGSSIPGLTWIDLPVASELIASSRQEEGDLPPAKRRRTEATNGKKPENLGEEEEEEVIYLTHYGNRLEVDNDEDDDDQEEEEARPRSRMISAVQVMDRHVQKIFEAAPPNSVVIVMTQGDLSPLRLLASQKMRSRWEMNSAKKKLQLADCSRTAWDPVADDKKIITAAAHAIAGAVFLKTK